MFQIKDGRILKNGKRFQIKGINLGGWFNREGYILGGRNIAEHIIWKKVLRQAGKEKTSRLIKILENNFITTDDFRRIRSFGFNTVRLPFNTRFLLTDNGSVSPEGIRKIKRAVNAIARHDLFVILDMHAAPGSQNADWHSDSDGTAHFWNSSRHQKTFLRLWHALSQAFRKHPAVIGYDILNEPNNKDPRKIFSVYEQALMTIRKNNDNKILFLEGNDWAQDISFLAPFARLFENVAISIHCYDPVSFAFNIITGLRYPGVIDGKKWNRKTLKKYYKKQADFARKNKAAILVGEFGISSRCPNCHAEFQLMEDVLSVFRDYEWHWTYWTYKSIAGMNFPDGLFQLNQNPFWLKRLHHTQSWENFAEIAANGNPGELRELARTLQTEYFDPNKPLIKILKKYL